MTTNTERLRGLFTASPLGYILSDSEGKVVWANKAANELLEPLGGIIELGSYLPDILAAHRFPMSVVRHISTLISEKSSPQPLMLPNNRLTFKEVKVTVELTLTWDEEGFLLALDDHSSISEERKLLTEAQQAAENLSTEKSAYFASMSHEIRTPMNAIQGFAGLLLQDLPTGEVRDRVRTIKQCGDNLMALLNDLLDSANIESGDFRLESEIFSPRLVVDEAVEMMARRAAEKEVEVLVVNQPGIPEAVRGDPARLRQILVTLLGNAIRTTTGGEVVISLGNEGPDDYGRLQLVFSVRDNGAGMTPEQLDHLFDPNQMNHATGGIGLGLVLCRRLVDLMEGEISARSTPEAGTTVIAGIPLPLVRGESQDEEEADVSGLEVLVVAENETNVSIMCQQMQTWGVKTKGANTGQQAMDHLLGHAGPCHVIVCENSLHDMTGIEFFDRLKDNPALSEIPTILLVGPGDLRAEAANDEHITAILTKPATPDRLRRGIGKASNRLKKVADTGSSIILRRPPIGRWRILVVEDVPTNQMVTISQLESLGCSADYVSDGREALAQLEKTSYDLILMDCLMPGMDGFKATEAVRNGDVGEALQEIPIIAMSASVLKKDRQQCFGSGMNDFLPKPVDRLSLARLLGKWLPRESKNLNSSSTKPEPLLSTSDEDTAGLPLVDHHHFHDELRQAFSEDPQFFDELVQGLKDQAALVQKHLNAPAGDLARAIHRLGSAAASMSAVHLATRCRRLERKLRTGVDEDLNRGIAAELDSLVKESIGALRNLVVS